MRAICSSWFIANHTNNLKWLFGWIYLHSPNWCWFAHKHLWCTHQYFHRCFAVPVGELWAPSLHLPHANWAPKSHYSLHSAPTLGSLHSNRALQFILIENFSNKIHYSRFWFPTLSVVHRAHANGCVLLPRISSHQKLGCPHCCRRRHGESELMSWKPDIRQASPLSKTSLQKQQHSSTHKETNENQKP